MHLYIIYKELLYTGVDPSFLNSSDCVIKSKQAILCRCTTEPYMVRNCRGGGASGGPVKGRRGGGQLRGFTVSESSCKIFYSLTTKFTDFAQAPFFFPA